MIIHFILLICLYLFLFIPSLFSSLLTKNLDVASISLGGSAISASLNPALTSKEDAHTVRFFHQFSFANNQLSHINYSTKFLNQFFEISFTYRYPIKINAINDFGISLGVHFTTEYMLYVLWSNVIRWNSLGEWWVPHKIEYGLSLKGYYSYLYSISIYTVALDGGFSITYGLPHISIRDKNSQGNLQISLSVRNLGLPFNFLEYREILPIQILGITKYTPFEKYKQKLSLLFQVEYTNKEWVSYVFAIELEILGLLYLRGGYRFPDEIRTFFFGCELKYNLLQGRSQASIQYSIVPLLSVGLEHNISFTFKYALKK